MFKLRLVTIVAIILFVSLYASGQSATATLGGMVLDQNDARVFEARVTITNLDTGLVRNTETNVSGYFVFTLLPPGRYQLIVKRNDFATVEANQLILAVNDARNLKILLRPGTISETVTVEGNSLVQTESAAVATLIDRKFVGNLPLNGRSFHSLVSLAPGVVLTKTDDQNQGQFSVNGQRADSNNFTVDGVSANFGISSTVDSGGSLPATNAFGGLSNLVSVDALEEFDIQTSTYAAEFGRYSGAQISVITRSGTNDFHGTAFEYFRNEALDANNWFANSAGLPQPALRQNDFGGVLGGPIVPKKTFFFLSYEGLRLRQPHVVRVPVPSLSLRQKTPAPMRILLDALPIPTEAFNSNTGFFNAGYSDPSSLDATSIRFDQKLTDRSTIFGRYNYSPSEILNRRQGGPTTLDLSRYKTTTLTVGATQLLRARRQNELRVNYSSSTRQVSSSLDDLGGAVVPPASILFPLFNAPDNARLSFLFGGATIAIGHSESHQSQINVVDNFSAVVNNHQLKFGIDYRKLMPVVSADPYAQSVSTSTVNAPLGLATTISITSRLGEVFPRFTNFSVYGQDTWKVSDRLTLTFGLRWELNPPPTEKNGNMPYEVIGFENPATMTLGGQRTKLWNTSYRDFAPRVGVSYLLRPATAHATVLRGGFGIFYDLGMGRAGSSLSGTGFPYATQKTFSRVAWPLSLTDAAPRPPSFDPPYIIGIFEPNLKSPRTYQWSAGISQALGANQVLSLSYVGAAGRYLKSSHRLVNPNPNFTSLGVTGDRGTSDYHALQVQFQRRLSRNLQALASYTWSHSIDTSSNDFYIREFTDDRFNWNDDRGNSDFDVRHSFSAAISYDVPAFVSGKLKGWAFRNWSLNATVFARTPTPMDVNAGSAFQRADVVPGVPQYLDDLNSPGGWRLNPAAFVAAPRTRQGTLGRNVLRAFPVFQVDLSVRRTFRLSERLRLQFIGEMFNLLNHPNFADPYNYTFGDPDVDAEVFGKAEQMLGTSLSTHTSSGNTGYNSIYQIGGPRSIQFALKLQF